MATTVGDPQLVVAHAHVEATVGHGPRAVVVGEVDDGAATLAARPPEPLDDLLRRPDADVRDGVDGDLLEPRLLGHHDVDAPSR